MRETELRDGTIVVQIGTCAGTREATGHVESVLFAKGIEPVVHGSRAYAICVPKDRVGEARQLLKSDPQKQEFGIFVYDD